MTTKILSTDTDDAESIRQNTVAVLKALANENRLQIAEWLRDPTAHFPQQVDGDLVTDGVCLGAIVRKTGLAQPTVTNYMKTLSEAGLVRSKRIKNWNFFRLEVDVMQDALGRLLSQP